MLKQHLSLRLCPAPFSMLCIVLPFLTLLTLPQVVQEFTVSTWQFLCSSVLLLPPHTSVLQRGPVTSCRGNISFSMALTSVLSLLFLTPFFPSSSLRLAFYEFLKICFHGGVISLADVFTCVLLWVHWSWLHLIVSGAEQHLAPPTEAPYSPTCLPPCQELENFVKF